MSLKPNKRSPVIILPPLMPTSKNPSPPPITAAIITMNKMSKIIKGSIVLISPSGLQQETKGRSGQQSYFSEM